MKLPINEDLVNTVLGLKSAYLCGNNAKVNSGATGLDR